ncbi:DNA-processing protein DprA [Noviherbaspirillum sp. Root189]|uniref:DNA-processing protein DprA n=1 Tax=Noviherbaspirillum sp. Root189 TaxID=1736487 RepID=UPI00070A59A5|nr:DNA-processing protein DprA [Noviherbaspirillum sp. Root189]KRB79100.1 DNA processing protein DprA [Noviherbaspirillum sp. Root189]
MIDTDWARDLAQWIRFEQTPGVGNDTGRRLLSAFGLPQHVFDADFEALAAVVPERVARALLAPLPSDTRALIDKTLDWASLPGNRVLTLADDDYPRQLLNISDPPLLLYIKGRIELLRATSIAVVGSRNATAQGVLNAEKFSESLSRECLTIVSGQALGIDTAAHLGGLRGVGSTIAVIGTGADTVYPARNRALAHQIADQGCIVSEYALGEGPIASHFPRRNRLISGLSRGVLVIEAAAQSGSLITARMAAEQGRDVFAIPGSIHSPLSKGCHLLIRQGAKLVDSAQHILEEIGELPSRLPAVKAPAVSGSAPECMVLSALGYDPVDMDTLATRCEIGIAELSARLLTHELDGLVETLPGGMIRRIATS